VFEYDAEAESMSTIRWTNSEIRARGWEALIEKLGPSGALRFAMLTEGGWGDSTRRRDRLFGGLSVNQLLARMRSRPTGGGRRRHRA
jgi:hypothetical protein